MIDVITEKRGPRSSADESGDSSKAELGQKPGQNVDGDSASDNSGTGSKSAERGQKTDRQTENGIATA